MTAQKACHKVYNQPSFSNISQSIYKDYMWTKAQAGRS
jgi:hypothetical protein